MVLLDILVICALITNGADNYDCSEKWIIYVYDVKYPPGCKDPLAIGCVSYFTNPIIANKIKPPVMLLGNSTYIDEFGFTNLRHEIEHLRCLCDFHGDEENPPEAPRR